MSLVPHVLMFTQRPYDFLEQKIESYKRKLVKQSLGVVFHSSSPLDILLHRRFVALIFLLIAAVQLFFTIHAVMQTVNPVVGTAFRFTPLELRSGSTDPSHPQIAGFSVFANEGGCLTAVEPETCYTEDKHHYCRFQSETRLDAFAVITGGPIEHDPVRSVPPLPRRITLSHARCKVPLLPSGHLVPGPRASDLRSELR